MWHIKTRLNLGEIMPLILCQMYDCWVEHGKKNLKNKKIYLLAINICSIILFFLRDCNAVVSGVRIIRIIDLIIISNYQILTLWLGMGFVTSHFGKMNLWPVEHFFQQYRISLNKVRGHYILWPLQMGRLIKGGHYFPSPFFIWGN